MLLAIRVFMSKVTALMWKKLEKDGGTDRTVTWKPFAPQYTRKDGTKVPLWGGIKKIRGEGSVRPRIRPSGQPYDSSSLLIQDTDRLRTGRLELQRLTPNKIKFGPTIVYAKKQHAMRPWSFFTPQEIPRAADSAFRVFTRHINKP